MRLNEQWKQELQNVRNEKQEMMIKIMNLENLNKEIKKKHSNINENEFFQLKNDIQNKDNKISNIEAKVNKHFKTTKQNKPTQINTHTHTHICICIYRMTSYNISLTN